MVFFTIARKMLEAGHHVDIICHKLENGSEEDLPGASIHRINPAIIHRSELPSSIITNLKYVINAVVAGSRIIANNNIDIIHTNSYSPVIAGSVLGKIHNLPTVSTIHDIFTTSTSQGWSQWAKQNNLGKFQEMLGPLLEKIMVRMPTNALHAISYATREDILRLNRNANIVVIHNGIELSTYEDHIKVLNYTGDPFSKYVVFIGRLVYYKNLDVVIRAFTTVKESIPDAKLVIVGKGIKRNDWEKLVLKLGLSQSVTFLGFLSQDEKTDILSKSSALVLPSLFEGFGLVILEAFALKKPVLVANERPYDEIVDNGLDGFLIPSFDPKAWAEKIILLLSDPSLCRIMGAKGREKVEKNFEIALTMKQINDLYQKISLP